MSHCLSKTHGQVDLSTRVEVRVMGDPITCRDNRHLTICQKQHRQNEPAGQVDVLTRVEIPRDGGSRTDVGTTDISRSVKTTERMKQLVR